MTIISCLLHSFIKLSNGLLFDFTFEIILELLSQLILGKILNYLHWINTISGPVLDSIVYDAAPHTCAPHQCSQDAQIIEAYNVGKIYEYDYVVDSIAEMRSASPSKESKLNMAARVKVQVLTPCEFSVKVSLI